MSNQENTTPSKQSVSRRKFIQSTTALAAGAAAVSPTFVQGQEVRTPNSRGDESRNNLNQRAVAAADVRTQAAQRHLEYTKELPAQRTNRDDIRYRNENYYASFTKTLPHNDLGEVDPVAYEALLAAVNSGEPAAFEAIPLDPTSVRTLANPQGALRFIYAGLDGHATRMPPAPRFHSELAACEMGEVYWLALTRDIPFASYRRNSTIMAAVSDMNNFSRTVGPTKNGAVEPDLLFRGSTPGDLAGPYISQFLWKTVNYGPATIEQKYANPTSSLDFMATADEWLNVQRGGAPLGAQTFGNDSRFIYNNRTLGEYVHGDVLFQAYFNAMLISFGFGGDAIAVGNPYGVTIQNQGAFTSLGGPWFIDLLTQAGNLALHGAWYQKWLRHRRLRPEVYAGRVHHHVVGNAEYELNEEILNSSALNRVNESYGSYFLPMAYPEGSPTHPSYPAGHATVAGACATVLKAVFDESFVIPDPVMTTDGTSLESYTGEALTLGGEFNKLASNIALGRDAAGVHYRTDGTEGLAVGEQQAIGLLQDYSAALNEDFGGFHFTKFDGTAINIIDGRVSS